MLGWIFPFFKTLPFLLSVLSGIAALICTRLAGGDFGVTFFLLLAGAFFVYGVISFLCGTPLGIVPVLRIVRGILRIVLLAVIAGFVLLLTQALSGSGSDPDPGDSVEAVIVLGAGLNGETPSAVLQARLDAALAFLKGHPGIPIVVTGGKGPEETIPEALAAQRYLVAHGVDPARIHMEDTSTDTVENIAHAVALLPPGTETVAVVSSDYHLYRVRRLCEQAGLTPVAVAAPSPYAYLTVLGYLRETFSLGKMWLGIGAQVMDFIKPLQGVLPQVVPS